MFARHKKLILVLASFLFLFVFFSSFFRAKYELDEIIYQTLAVKLEHFRSYNLKGTAILNSIPQKTFDTKIFFYPPTFIILLSLFHAVLGGFGFKILPPVLYVLFAILIYKTVFIISKSKDTALKGFVISSFSSLLLFTSVRDQMDLFMALTALLSFYFILLFNKTGRHRDIFLSGMFMAVSVLTKYVSAILILFYVPFLLGYLNKKRKLTKIYLFFIPLILPFVWGVYFLSFNPSLTFFMYSENSKILASYNFLNYVYHRPLYFYFLNIFLVNPVYFLIFILLKGKEREEFKKKFGFTLVFLTEIILFILMVFTIIGILGGTYQTRYILLAEPFLIILVSLVNFEKNKFARLLFIIFLVHNLFIFFFNAVLLNSPEAFSLFELSRFFSLHKMG